MKLTIKQKREIIRQFKQGERVPTLALNLWKLNPRHESYSIDAGIRSRAEIEEVIRDYVNGRFAMKVGKAYFHVPQFERPRRTSR